MYVCCDSYYVCTMLGITHTLLSSILYTYVSVYVYTLCICNKQLWLDFRKLLNITHTIHVSTHGLKHFFSYFGICHVRWEFLSKLCTFSLNLGNSEEGKYMFEHVCSVYRSFFHIYTRILVVPFRCMYLENYYM